MSITLAYGGETVTLPADMTWRDEHAWKSVAQARSYSLTGALIVETAAKLSGRPITLAGALDSAWMPRATLNKLRGWADVAGAVLSLSLRGVVYAVQFDHEAGPLQAESVADYADPLDADPYAVVLYFFTVPVP